MSDILSKEDRALIDAAVDAGKVKRVARGKSGFAGYEWCGEENKLKAKEGGNGKQNIQFGRNYRKKKGPSPETARRRVKVVEMRQQGMTMAQVAAQLGITVAMVNSDCRALNYTPGNNWNNDVGEANRAAVQAHYDGKRTIKEISNLTGLAHQTVSKHMQTLGLKPVPPKWVRKS